MLDLQLSLLNIIRNQEIYGFDVIGTLPTGHATIIFQKHSRFIVLKEEITLYSVSLRLYELITP